MKERSLSGSECWMVCRHWTPEIKFNKRLSSSIIRLVNYSITTSLIYKTDSIGDAQSFSGKTPIIPSGGFSVETLTRVTPLWKTEWIGVSPSWKTEYLEGCSTAMRHVVRKMAAVEGGLVSEIASPQGCSFPDRWTCIWQIVSSVLFWF